jgi:hypothetical protein
MTAWQGVRWTVNLLNLSTPLGLLIALVGGARRITAGPGGVLLCDGYRLRVPSAPAFTVGSAIMFRDVSILADRPRLLVHETKHTTQYAWCLGTPMLPLYFLASGASLVLCGDPASFNPFERLAGLADGGYTEHPLRF